MTSTFLKRITITMCVLWLVVCGAMAQIDKLVFTRMDASDGLNDNRVQHIIQLPDGRMAVTTRGNINIYDGAQFRYIHAVEGDIQKLERYNGAYHVYVDDDERLWMKDWRRVQCFNLRQGKYVADIDSLFRSLGVEEEVKDLYVDSEGHLWLVTEDNAFNTSTSQTIPLDSNEVVLQDLDVYSGLVYLFFSNSEVKCFDGNSNEVYSAKAFAEDKAANYTHASLVVRSPDGNFYQLRSGRECACLRFNPETRVWKELLSVDYPLHTLIATDSSNIYITSRWRILHVNTENDEIIDVPMLNIEESMGESNNLNTIFKDNQGGIWLGTYETGLLYAHPSRFRIKSYKEDMPASLLMQMPIYEKVSPEGRLSVTCRLTDSRGWQWCGSSDGVYVYPDSTDTPVVLYTEDGLSNCYVHSLIEDKNADVWAATSYGLNRIRVKENPTENTSDYKARFSINSFTEQDGALSCAYRDNQVLSLPTGHLVFRALSGYTVLHPDSLAPLQMHINPILTGVSLNGERLTVGHPLLPEAESYMKDFEFAYNENNITFDIASLNYCLPEHTRMEYRILSDKEDGILSDKEDTKSKWHEASVANGLIDSDGVLHISFLKASPANYTLQVRACDSDSSVPLTLTFRILPPWWQTDWAQTLFFLFVLLFMVAANIVYLRISRLRMRQRHKEEILLMRIRNLIERCDTLSSESHRYDAADGSGQSATVCADGQEAEDTGGNIVSEEDNEFIRLAIEMVEKNINTRGYTVEQLSRDLCMERTGLYKKMTTLLDKSPSLFIRSIRLQRAAALLRESNMTFTEIAEHTGFSSSSHMSKCFQEEWGCKPGKIRNENLQ